MLTITGNGRITRKPELRTTTSGKTVTTVSVASDRRSRDEEPIYVDLILWEAQAEAAAKHLVKGQAVSFSGRPDTRAYSRSDGEAGAALEVHAVELEYGAKPRDRNQQDATEPVKAAA
jgi:single-strand DNA-binding protein